MTTLHSNSRSTTSIIHIYMSCVYTYACIAIYPTVSKISSGNLACMCDCDFVTPFILDIENIMVIYEGSYK